MILVLCWLIQQPVLSKAQESSSRVRKIGRSLFELQQNFLQLKSDYDKKKKEWKSQQEAFQLLVERLTHENQLLKEQVSVFKTQIQSFEERLEGSSFTKFSNNLKEINKLLESILLETVDEKIQAEELVLEIINDPYSNLPKDILILYLATIKRKEVEFDQSLGYYGTLISQFPESQHLSHAIYEMSEVFGMLDKKNEQKTLLLQLSILDEPDNFSQKAKEKLKKLQLSLDESAEQPELLADTSADVPTARTPEEMEISEVPEKPEQKPDTVSDGTSDLIPETVPNDSAAEVLKIPETEADLTSDPYHDTVSESSTTQEAPMTQSSEASMLRQEIDSDVTSDHSSQLVNEEKSPEEHESAGTSEISVQSSKPDSDVSEDAKP